MRSHSHEARVQQKIRETNPKNIMKGQRGRMLINNDDWPLDGNLMRSSATAEDAPATPRSHSQDARHQQQFQRMFPKTASLLSDGPPAKKDDWPQTFSKPRTAATAADEVTLSSDTDSRSSTPSPQPKVRSQVFVVNPQRDSTPKVRSQIVQPTPRTPTKRNSISVPGKGRTDLVHASVALKKQPKPLLKLQRQPKTHKLVTVRRKKGKARGTPRAEPMDTSEPTSASQSQPSQQSSKTAGATAAASSSSGITSNAPKDVRRSTAFIGGKTPSSSKQFRETVFDKVLKIGTKKRIVDPPAQVIPFADTHVRKDILTYLAQNTPHNRELPVTFEWHTRVPQDYQFAFAIAHFGHPASLVPTNLLAAVPTEHAPTPEECAAEHNTYDNGYLRGALYGCSPHLTFFTNLGVRHHIKQHIVQNKDFRPVGILTGLDFSKPEIETTWTSMDDMIQTQIAAYTDFALYAMELHEQALYRPLCLHFNSSRKCARHPITEGLQILLRLGLPRAFPIYLINWVGTPTQSWEWLRNFPRTMFGVSTEITRLTDADNLQWKREFPLDHLFLESGTPGHRPDGSFRTGEDVLTLADVLQEQVGENHGRLLAHTTINAFNFFFPQEVAPANWHCPPTTQPTARVTVAAKIAALDVIAAAQAGATAPAGLAAPGGPSAQQKGTKKESAKFLKQAWSTLEDDGAIANFFKEKMDEFSPHYTTKQEQQLLLERQREFAASSLTITKVSTELRVALSGEQRLITEQATSSRNIQTQQTIAAGTSTAAAHLSQSSAAATAAAAPSTAPATPDNAASAAPPAPVLALDRVPLDIQGAQLPSEVQPPMRTHPPGFNSPTIKADGTPFYSGWEPLLPCPGHGRNAQHMTLAQALKDYKRICRQVPADRRVDGAQLMPHSFGEMFCVIWAQRFAHFPRTGGTPSVSSSSTGTPVEPPRRPNLSVHDFMNAILRNEPSAIPTIMNRYFRQVTQGTDQPLFSPGDIGTAILRWYESCPTAALYLRANSTGPVRYQPTFLEGCDPEIIDAFLPVWQESFCQALDYVRLRVYMVQVRRHPMWTTPQEAPKLKKSELRLIKVDGTRILQSRQIMLTDTWGDYFIGDVRPDVHVRRLPGLAAETVDLVRDYYLGHSVEKIYLLWGRDELLHGAGNLSDYLFKMVHHLSQEFPYVQVFLVLPPYVARQHDSYIAHVQRILRAQQNSFKNTTLVWFPMDTQLSDYVETARRENRQADWATALQTADGTPSAEGIQLRKAFWEQRYDVTLWLDAQRDQKTERPQEAASLNAVEDLEQQLKQTTLPDHGPPPPPNAGDDSSAMDHEPSEQSANDAEGTPSAVSAQLPAQEELPSTRASTADSSGVEILERDDSPGVFSNFSGSPAPGPSADVVPLFQHLINIKTIQPDLQPQINQQTLALLFPQAGPELLGKLWGDYQKLQLNYYAVQPPAAKVVGKATAFPRPEPSQARSASTSSTEQVTQQLHELLYRDETRSRYGASSPDYESIDEGQVPNPRDAQDWENDYEPILDDPELPPADDPNQELDDAVLDEEEWGLSSPRAAENSSQPMEEQSAPPTETRNSEDPSTADDTTGGTTGRTTSSTSDPWTHDGPTGSDDW